MPFECILWLYLEELFIAKPSRMHVIQFMAWERKTFSILCFPHYFTKRQTNKHRNTHIIIHRSLLIIFKLFINGINYHGSHVIERPWVSDSSLCDLHTHSLSTPSTQRAAVFVAAIVAVAEIYKHTRKNRFQREFSRIAVFTSISNIFSAANSNFYLTNMSSTSVSISIWPNCVDLFNQKTRKNNNNSTVESLYNNTNYIRVSFYRFIVSSGLFTRMPKIVQKSFLLMRANLQHTENNQEIECVDNAINCPPDVFPFKALCLLSQILYVFVGAITIVITAVAGSILVL